MVSQKETTTYLYLNDEEPIKYSTARFRVEVKDTKEEINMTNKFTCSECGENEVDEEGDICDDCLNEEYEGDDE